MDTCHFLSAHAAELLAAWRQHSDLVLEPRARAALEQLLLPAPPPHHARADLAALQEQVRYSAARLAKLSVPLTQVNAALNAFQPFALACLGRAWDEGPAAAAQNQWQQQTAMAVAEAYVASQSNAVHAMLGVLDAELNAPDLAELLQRLLRQAAHLFPMRWGEILLAHDGRLYHAAACDLPAGVIDTAPGAFVDRVFHDAAPGFLRERSREARLAPRYFKTLKAKSLWAVPLVRRQPGAEVLGVLVVAFDRTYDCLPQEHELLQALAERSTLAIDRIRMVERLTQQQQRVMELSRRLLDAQDEERRRVSRDLHDETGQALMALRLYFEMGLRAPDRAAARTWLERGVSLVDLSVAELRRILAQLSPLLLDELGLEAALRLEFRKLRTQHQWRTRFQFSSGGRTLDRSLEILVYRVVVEGLRNIGRHAQAHRVHLAVEVGPTDLKIHLSDDGVGLPAPAATPSRPQAVRTSTRFGLSGMRERVRLAGGRLHLASVPGRGLQLSIRIPLPAAAAVARQAS